MQAETRLVDRAIQAWEAGERSSASLAAAFERIITSGHAVRPGFIPTSYKPTHGVSRVAYVRSLEDLAYTSLLRRRQIAVRAPGLPKLSERTELGPRPVSDGKTRDHKARKGDRARKSIRAFVRQIDKRMRAFRTATSAQQTRDFISATLSDPNVSNLFSRGERRKLHGTMRAAAHRVKRAKRAGII